MSDARSRIKSSSGSVFPAGYAHADFADTENLKRSSSSVKSVSTVNVSTRTLLPSSSSKMNTLNTTTSTSTKPLNPITNGTSTIRTVPNDDIRATSSNPRTVPKPTRSEATMPSLNIRSTSSTSTSNPYPTPVSPSPQLQPNSIMRSISTEFGTTVSYSNNFRVAEDNTNHVGTSPSPVPEEEPQQWSSAIGRANLGKSGRVIERLMADNDMLKRSLTIERLRAEESNEAAKNTETKMQGLLSDYEKQLHDAAVNKSLLKRRERQLSDLKTECDVEKARTIKAVEQAQEWRETCDKVKSESQSKVEAATNYALLVEGRNDALTSHWKQQGVEVTRAMGKMRKEIEGLVEQRKKDDERMKTLQKICDEQDALLQSLKGEKREIAEAFSKYQQEQEDSLRGIKQKAAAQELANENKAQEMQSLLGQLKWALNVQKNVKGAQ